MTKIHEKTMAWGERPQNGVNIILTHADMDGLVAAHLVKTYLQIAGEGAYIVISNLKVGVGDTDAMLNTALKAMKMNISDLDQRDVIWILDRPCLTKDTIHQINNEVEINICDHHETNVDGHNYVKEYFNHSHTYLETDINHCGASLALDLVYWLSRHVNYDDYTTDRLIEMVNSYNNLVVTTNDWDTFRWKTLEKEDRKELAKKIQAMDKVFGAELTWTYLNEAQIVGANDVLSALTSKITIAYEIFQAKFNENKIICKIMVEENMRTLTMQGRGVRICFMYGMEEYQSMLSDYIFTEFPIVDVVIWMCYGGTISIRVSDKSPVKANDLAKLIGESNGFSGGGHPKAAGGRVEDIIDIKSRLLEKVLVGLRNKFDYIPSDLYRVTGAKTKGVDKNV